MKPLHQLMVGIKGAGEMASAIAYRLFKANIRNIYMMEIETPLAVRRNVSFCECIFKGKTRVEDIEGVVAKGSNDICNAWKQGQIPVTIDPSWNMLIKLPVDVLVDAIIAKKNIGTNITDAPLVIGIGPGFTAGIDVHMVIESNRGHHLGRIIESGSAEPNTGIPGDIKGFSVERVFKAPIDGIFHAKRSIGDKVAQNELIGFVDDHPIHAAINGMIRGILRSNIFVKAGTKLGDIDPRGILEYCDTISDKARSISGSVLEAIMRRFNNAL